ncbi:hypothetical protein AB0H00_15780 [Nocardia sp. NPDC023852]|uniref:hypothetical protein n=1 Tax=Nocardia sp. NPDC023852 TaxID=3154697 RepID=UPI0033C3E253
MTVRVGAVHLGWDVVSVAAGGGGTPIRPVQVEGMWTPPAYLLADSSGRLYTAGVERKRPDLGMAIADVRDILGHPQIVVAGATWPAELVFRARLYNPLAEIGKHVRGKPDLVALPFPDGWPDEKVDVYATLVEQLDVTVEPLPESVALSGYVRALGLVHPPDQARPHGIGATGVYSDGRTMLVVAVHGDDEQPTESVDVPVDAAAMRDARSADNVVIEVMAAARSIGADTSTVLLSGNVCFNDALRLAFQNHLGHRLQVADHPMHALVLGAAHLLVTDTESGEPVSTGRPAEPAPGPGSPVDAARQQAEYAQQQAVAAQQQADAGHRRTESGSQRPEERPPQQPGTWQRGTEQPFRSVPGVQYGPGYPSPQEEEATTRIGRDQVPQGLPPNLAELGSRFTRPPSQHPDEQQRRPQGEFAGPPQGPLPGGPVPPLGSRPSYQGPPDQQLPYQGAQQQRGGQRQEPGRESDEEDPPRKGKRWNKMKGNLFGANTVVGAVALAVIALPSGGDRVELAAETSGAVSSDLRAVASGAVSSDLRAVASGAVSSDLRAVSGVGSVALDDEAAPGRMAPIVCELTPYAINQPKPGIATARDSHSGERTDESGVPACAGPGIDTLRYVVPGPPGAIDPGPPFEI